MYHPEKDALFIHFSKTGGMWTQKILSKFGFRIVDLNVKGGHLGINDLDFVTKNTYTFGFVRNPISWHISLFNFLDSNNWNFKGFSRYKSSSLNEHLSKIYTSPSQKVAFSIWFNDMFGVGSDLECKNIFRYEEIYNGLKKALQNVNINAETEIEMAKDIKKNKTLVRDSYISKENIRLIFLNNKQIFEKYKYNLDGG